MKKQFKHTMNIKRIGSILVLSVAVLMNASAQKDTVKRQSIEVTSSYKPVLRNAAKVNFNATAAQPDTTIPRLQYNIPAQNLFFTYQPVPLKAVAVAKDSLLGLGGASYVKVGFGNYQTPYIKAGFAFGNGTTSVINAYADHISQKGNLPYQQYSNTSAYGMAVFRTPSNLEFNLKGGFSNDQYYRYGYNDKTLSFNKDSLRARYSNITLQAGLRNVSASEFGLLYNPNLRINIFSDNFSNTETNAVLNAPLEKTVGKYFSVKLGATFDLTKYNPKNQPSITNNVFLVDAGLQIKSPNVNIYAGIRPSWDNSVFKMLPNITGDLKLSGDKLVLQAGYIGTVRKNSFMSLTGLNPWIDAPALLVNTRVEEFYGGVKGSVDEHFSFNAKAGYFKWTGMPSIYNRYFPDTTGKEFVTDYTTAEGLQIHGGISLVEGERFSLEAGATFYQLTNKNSFQKPLGTYYPVDINGSLRWQLLKDFWLKSDVYIWNGPYYVANTKPLPTEYKNKGSVDLNAGLEFRITKNLNLWGQFNNIFNNKYERWNQYPALGFNLQGGIIFRFDTKGLTK